MPYTLEWSLERQLITIRRVGFVTYQEIKASLQEIGREIVSTFRPHLLVDIRAATRYPDKAELLLAADTNCRELHLSRRTAFITNGDVTESIRFLVLTASNRGYEVKLFSDEKPALDWLFASQATSP
jgi:hypothetical protein